MKKSDIGVVAIIYALIIAFFIPTLSFPSEAQIYPLIVMAILTLLNTLYLINCLMKYFKDKKIERDLSEIFEGFQPKQFLIVLVLCIVYVFLISLLGFYIATFLYMLGTMIFLKVPKKHVILTVVCFMALVYGTFTMFLRVPLPTGIFM